MRLRGSVKHFPGNPACCKREPGDKSDPVTLTIIHHVVPFTVGEAISVLHRHDRDNLARSLDVLLRDVGQCDQANLSLVSQLRESFHRRLERHRWIWSVKLIDIDAI